MEKSIFSNGKTDNQAALFPFAYNHKHPAAILFSKAHPTDINFESGKMLSQGRIQNCYYKLMAFIGNKQGLPVFLGQLEAG